MSRTTFLLASISLLCLTALGLTIPEAKEQITKLEAEAKSCQERAADAQQKANAVAAQIKSGGSTPALQAEMKKHTIDAGRARKCVSDAQSKIAYLRRQIRVMEEAAGRTVRDPHEKRK